MRIGIELNGVVRDINFQYLKYYLKDINPTFDDTVIDEKKSDIFEDLPFESKKKRYQFKFEDYPYELFGCAPPTSRNLHTYINGWLHDYEDEYDDVSFFSLNEEELTIQSTYFYLSKSGSRVRKMTFPRSVEELWNSFDIVVTCNKDVVKNKPSDKIVVLINKTDNEEIKTRCQFNYDDLVDFLSDKDFFNTLNSQKRENIKNKVFYKIRGIIDKIVRKCLTI